MLPAGEIGEEVIKESEKRGVIAQAKGDILLILVLERLTWGRCVFWVSAARRFVNSASWPLVALRCKMEGSSKVRYVLQYKVLQWCLQSSVY